jgi:hypothetical protein
VEASSTTPEPDSTRADSTAERAPVIVCPDCPQGPRAKRFPSEIARAIHRRQMHGIAMPASVRKELEEARRAGRAVAASADPDLERVPARALDLPWLRWPDDPAVCESIVGRIDVVADEAMSEAERRFWASVRSVAATIAERGRAV